MNVGDKFIIGYDTQFRTSTGATTEMLRVKKGTVVTMINQIGYEKVFQTSTGDIFFFALTYNVFWRKLSPLEQLAMAAE